MFDARPVQGAFRRLRWAADGALIAILVAVPWIRVGGEPLVLLDIPARKFHVFGLVIFPQELYFLWLILAGLALALFFFTALLGRLWCGWACPQTVFTDVFAALVRWVEGWRGSRRPRRVAAWRRVLLHALLLALSAAVGFHLVGYFRSPYAMLSEIASGSLSATTGGFLVFAGALSYVDFVWVRQTFCKYLCPYARFQGVLFDRDTLVVGYDARRGEPRGKAGRVAGDCVDCGLCVAVCPTGIDIREGLQLECIACTQCIDACDGVMEKLGRAPKLIGYRSLVGLEGERPARVLRPRVLAYGLLLLVVAGAFALLLERRVPMDLQVAHNRGALVTRAADGRVGNAFTLRVQNRDRESRTFRITLQDAPEELDLIAGVNPVEVAALSSIETRVFVMAPQGWEGARRRPELRFVLEDVRGEGRRVERRARLLLRGGEGRAHEARAPAREEDGRVDEP